jgi:LysM repeat protein
MPRAMQPAPHGQVAGARGVKQWNLGQGALPGRPGHAAAGQAGKAEFVKAPPAAESKRVRSVLVKKRETLGHYCAWSRLSTQQIKDANPGLNPNLIFIGKKLKLPMTDSQYAVFVQKRAEAFLSPKQKRQREARRAKVAAQMRQKAALDARLSQAPRGAVGNKPRPLVPAAIRPAMMPVAGHAPTAKPAAADVKIENRRYHFVKARDTASRIAVRWKTNLVRLKELNPGLNLDVIRLGAKIRVR